MTLYSSVTRNSSTNQLTQLCNEFISCTWVEYLGVLDYKLNEKKNVKKYNLGGEGGKNNVTIK
jgi:hypothetical protein